MRSVRFRTGDIDLELSGSESFVMRQLLLLSPGLGAVDASALNGPGAPVTRPSAEQERSRPPPAPPSAVSEPARPLAGAGPLPEPLPLPAPERDQPLVAEAAPEPPPPRAPEPPDELVQFYRSFPSGGRDTQAEAALLFAYFMQQKQGVSALHLGDFVRCFVRAGVDSLNLHRALGVLSRRGHLETHGGTYRLSDQGLAAVQEREKEKHP
jgi:hypothetical protein